MGHWRNMLMPWLLIFWLIALLGHQQPWYWLCRINGALSSVRNDVNYPPHLSVEKWLKNGTRKELIINVANSCYSMGLLPDTQNRGLRLRRECRERFSRYRLQRKPLVSDPGMHHGTCVTHVAWCMSWSLTCGGGENVPGIPCACATRNFAYLVRGPWYDILQGWLTLHYY